jgi:hypothetical protein
LLQPELTEKLSEDEVLWRGSLQAHRAIRYVAGLTRSWSCSTAYGTAESWTRTTARGSRAKGLPLLCGSWGQKIGPAELLELRGEEFTKRPARQLGVATEGGCRLGAR